MPLGVLYLCRDGWMGRWAGGGLGRWVGGWMGLGRWVDLREHVLLNDGLILVQHGLEDPLLAGRVGCVDVVL